jgi:hypothetical protein
MRSRMSSNWSTPARPRGRSRTTKSCVPTYIDFLSRQGCEAVGVETWGCDEQCQPFHGDTPAGERCEWYGNFHTCEQGLECVRVASEEDRCIQPCGRESELCVSSIWSSCETHHLVCRSTDDAAIGTCVPAPVPGEPCPESWCADGSLCSGGPSEERVCTPLPDVGEPCPDGMCRDDAVCSPGLFRERVCTPRAGAGEPCQDTLCDYGTYCDFSLDERVCVVFPMLGEPCPLGVCLPPAVCDDTMVEPSCIPPREDDEGCTEPYHCLSSNCVEGVCTPQTPAICTLAQRLPLGT